MTIKKKPASIELKLSIKYKIRYIVSHIPSSTIYSSIKSKHKDATPIVYWAPFSYLTNNCHLKKYTNLDDAINDSIKLNKLNRDKDLFNYKIYRVNYIDTDNMNYLATISFTSNDINSMIVEINSREVGNYVKYLTAINKSIHKPNYVKLEKNVLYYVLQDTNTLLYIGNESNNYVLTNEESKFLYVFDRDVIDIILKTFPSLKVIACKKKIYVKSFNEATTVNYHYNGTVICPLCNEVYSVEENNKLVKLFNSNDSNAKGITIYCKNCLAKLIVKRQAMYSYNTNMATERTAMKCVELH